MKKLNIEGVNMTFKQEFFKIYDRKIASGEITFSKSGITKNDFTRLCIEPDFVFSKETLKKICMHMNLNEEETLVLFNAAGYNNLIK